MNKNIQTGVCRDLPQKFWRIQFVVLVILLVSSSIFAAVTLDPTFGTGGKVNVRFLPDSIDYASDAAIQPDGKIVIVGGTEHAFTHVLIREILVVRLNSDGSLDQTFGSGGWVATDFSLFTEEIAATVRLQPDGKIVVGGISGNFMALARYHPDGSLDESFGTRGKVTTDFEEGTREWLYYLFQQADGKFVAVGAMATPQGNNQSLIILARYNSDGSLDSTFGTGGKHRFNFGFLTYLYGAAMQADGKILISGRFAYNVPGCIPDPKSGGCTDDQSFILRFNQNLTLDKKFGRRKGREFTGRTSANGLYGLTPQPDGTFLAGISDFTRRYSNNGFPLATFQRAVFPNQPSFQTFNAGSYKTRADGTIVGCGALYSDTSAFTDIGLVSYSSAGQLLTAHRADFYGFNDYCIAVLLQPDNKVVVVGRAQTAQNSHYNISVMRFSDFTP